MWPIIQGGEHFFEVSLGGGKELLHSNQRGGDGLLHGNQGGAKEFLKIYRNFHALQTVARTVHYLDCF